MAIPFAIPEPRVLRPRRAVPSDAVRPTRAEINLGNLRHNLRVLRRFAGATRVFGVLKADGYGHGAPAVARTLERAGIDGICVALLEEAIELREAGIRAPIIVMGGYYGQGWGEVIARDLTPVIYDLSHLEAIRRGLPVDVAHAANSAALMRLPRARYDLSRPGIALFGVAPCAGACDDLRPVMRVRSEIVALRDILPGDSAGYCSTWKATRPSRIATVPVGYADGLPRVLSNRGRVLIRGASAPIVGNVSMDLITVDATDIPGVTMRDEVVVLGTQQGPLGTSTVTSEEIAGLAGTIPWEVLTGISRRVPRFYREP